MSSTKSNVLDLFCGAGGFSCGFEQAGYNIIAGIDANAEALETYANNHNSKAIQCDLSTANPEHTLSENGIHPYDIDVIVGGPPCQGFSLAGNRDEDDDRNELVREYFEWIEYIRPDIFVMENVPGLLSMQDGEVINWILNRAEELGYSVDYDTLDAADYGVPQHRKRLIVTGVLNGQPALPEPTHGDVE